MNYYVLVEGSSVEPKVYAQWIPRINPSLRQVHRIVDVRENHFVIISGGGYPQYLDRVNDAVLDIRNHPQIDRLVISIDSETMTLEEKHSEVDAVIAAAGPVRPYKIIVQHYCFESWCLGNRKIAPRAEAVGQLRTFRDFFDVGVRDPETMESIHPEVLTRSQFAFRYLAECVRNKAGTYSKRDPSFLANARFLFHLEKRFQETGHIASIRALLEAFA